MAGTLKYVASKGRSHTPGVIEDSIGGWSFTYDPAQTPIVSSTRKHIFRGIFEDKTLQKTIPACAVAFDNRSFVAFGNECANLGLLTSLGVGPKLLTITHHHFAGMSAISPVIIEQDAGENLARLLRDKTLRGEAAPILHAIGTPERKLENLKILYDVYVQVLNAHQAGVYHKDLRCENVCVRRFGRLPADIRATVIDFELSATLGSGEPRAQASLYRTLFSEIPTRTVGFCHVIEPNPLELDMGYLAALHYHLLCDDLPLNGAKQPKSTLDRFISFLQEHIKYYGYSSLATPPYARDLSQSLDIDWMAQALELVPVTEAYFGSKQLLIHARSYHRPYLDAEDMRNCMSSSEARFAKMIDRIVAAKFESYKALRRKQGLQVVYERIEDQPMDLRRSNYAQAEHVPVKVRALGYLLVPEEESSSYEEITSFTEEQVEALARLEHDRWMRERLEAGWTLDRTSASSDPSKKTSPYLIPYDELSNNIQEYDRDAVRQLIPLVRSAGLVVARPK